MKSALVICLSFGLSAVTFASPIDDWYEPENEIENSDETWSSLDGNGFDLFDDDRSLGKNVINIADERALFTNTIGNDRCSCSNNRCKCCGHAHKISICAELNFHFGEKTVDVTIEANDKVFIKKTLSIERAEKICSRLPAVLRPFEVCFDANTSDLPGNSGFQSCPKMQVLMGFRHMHTIAEIPFSCVDIKLGHLPLYDSAMDLFKIEEPTNHQ